MFPYIRLCIEETFNTSTTSICSQPWQFIISHNRNLKTFLIIHIVIIKSEKPEASLTGCDLQPTLPAKVTLKQLNQQHTDEGVSSYQLDLDC
jgi:hypothetical protein